MALIKCGECGKSMSDRAAVCPHCGAPPLSIKLKPLPSPGSGVAATPTWQKVVMALLLIGVVGSCLDKKSKPKPPPGFSVGDARYLCERAFRMVAKDPEKAEIPYVQSSENGDEIQFAWGANTKMLRMRNGLGMEVAASGSCAVSRSGKRVISLTLNGQTII